MKNPRSDYYEGMLQLRNPNKEVVKFLKNQVKKAGEFIAKEVMHKDGCDYYISSQKFLKNLGKKLQQSFKGDLKINYRLFSRDRQTSKDIYRISVFFRLFKNKKGDTIDFKGDKFVILGFGKDILCRNLKTGEKNHIDFDKIS